MQPRDLSGHLTYEPGLGGEEVAAERGIVPDALLTLSSNENALGPAPAAVATIREHADRVHRYPKSAHVDLVEQLAARWAVDPAQVWLANGGDGALDYLSRAMLDPGDIVLVPEPGFAYYRMSANYHHATARPYELDRATDFELAAETVLSAYDGERIVYITSPHNPTGVAMAPPEIETVAEETGPETLVVVDEAYAAFSTIERAIDLVRDRDDVAVLGSFSKSYGLAGLRLGYAIVPAEWADAYARVNTPFAASAIACRAGLAALGDDDHLERSVNLARRGRAFLREHLDAPTWASEGNFVLVDVGDATTVTGALIDRGIIVRDCTSFGLPACIRITVAPEPELRRAVEACNDVLDTRRGGTDG